MSSMSTEIATAGSMVGNNASGAAIGSVFLGQDVKLLQIEEVSRDVLCIVTTQMNI